MRIILTILILLISTNSLAAQKYGIGKIERISVYSSGGEKYRTFDVQGLNSSGMNCYQSDVTKMVTIAIENTDLGESQYSLIMAAYMSKEKVRVKVDDAKTIGNFCALQLIQVCATECK